MSGLQLVYKISLHRWTAAASIAAVLACGAQSAPAANFVDPAVFASANGLLDIMIVAKAKPIPSIAFTPPSGHSAINPTGWVYEICRRPSVGLSCPTGSGTVADYGGVRLALQQGDTLKIRFVNKLPRIDPAKLTHETDPGEANLYLNPSNLHTHGMLVPARAPTLGDPTFGDYVFVSIFNSANGIPVPQTTHQHGPIVLDTVDYRIDIPANHPSGLFWFHPHIHGIALNQVSQGMAGIITIGQVGDNVRGDAVNTPFPDADVRHLTLKDIEVLAAGTVQFDSGPQTVANGEVLNQEDPDFCAQFPASHEVRRGSCPGQDNSADEGNNFTGGRWYFTVSGQQYPTIRMTNPDGEVWRLTNASGSLSYDLQLINDADNHPMVMQLIAVDGVSVHLPQDTPMGAVIKMAGAKFKVVSCPLVDNIGYHSLPVCIDELVMMPSSRAELWVTYRSSNNHVGPSPAGATATFKMVGLTMGSGDHWPAIDLAAVQFAQSGPRKFTRAALDIHGDALASMQPAGIFSAPVLKARAASLPPGCGALPSGHRRRIFFGFEDVTVDGTFALGYEELDQHGNVVPGTQRPVQRFDPSQNTVCLPLGPGQTPVHETWELVQLSTENHNFHVHQARFRISDASAPSSSPLAIKANSSNGGGIIQDNIPLGVAVPHIPEVNDSQNGVCTVDQWRSGKCSSTPIVLDIPFSQLGEFVYHCHILEHEDGGMMAKIQVVPSPN
jgi:FtsP/CotA-like multicopper oxidase with cupredoxin domain